MAGSRGDDKDDKAVICGVTWGFLAIVGLAILVVGMVVGAIVAVVGIESERKLEEGE